MSKMKLLLLLGTIGLASCDQPREVKRANETMVSLYQFTGQSVQITACGAQIISGRIFTDNDNATGHSTSRVFTKRVGCKLDVQIGTDFDASYDLSEQTNYVLVTYTGNPNYVDGLEECGPPCVGYAVSQYEEEPLLD